MEIIKVIVTILSFEGVSLSDTTRDLKLFTPH